MSMTVQNNPVHNQPQVQVPVDPSQVQNQGAADKVAADALSIISGANLMVQDNLRTDPTKRVANTGKAVDIDEVPELDDEDVKAMLAILDDLEKLIAELKNDSTEEQIAIAKERIASLRDKLKQQHTERLDKVDQSMKDIDKATDAKKSQERMGILSCVLAVVSAIVAVVAVAAAIFTGGASLAIAAAVIAGVGALCNVANAGLTIYQTVNKDGLEQQVKDKAEQYRDQGMSSSEAWKKASSEVNDKFLIASICLSVGGLIGGLALGGASSMGDLVKLVGLIQTGLSAASVTAGIANMVVSSDASDASYDAQSTQAELKQLEALLEKLKKALEDDNGELQKLLQELQQALVQLAQLLEGAVSTTEEVANNTGATA